MGLGELFCLSFEFLCCVVDFSLGVVIKNGFMLRGFSVIVGLFLCPCWIGCLLVVVYLGIVVCFLLILCILCVFGFMFVFSGLEVHVLGMLIFSVFLFVLLGFVFGGSLTSLLSNTTRYEGGVWFMGRFVFAIGFGLPCLLCFFV